MLVQILGSLGMCNSPIGFELSCDNREISYAADTPKFVEMQCTDYAAMQVDILS